VEKTADEITRDNSKKLADKAFAIVNQRRLMSRTSTSDFNEDPTHKRFRRMVDNGKRLILNKDEGVRLMKERKLFEAKERRTVDMGTNNISTSANTSPSV